MAKRQIFERKAPEQDYLAKLEELLKKNKGSGLYEGYDVNPRAFRIGGKVVDPSGLGQDRMKDEIKFAPYDYSTIPFSAPRLGSVGQYNFPDQEQPAQEQAAEQPNYNTPQGFQQVLREMTAIPVSTTQDGGILLSNGFIEYQDGTRRQATYQDVPRVVRQFNDGSVLLENGQFINASDRVGRAYRGLGGLMDILFGQQQAVTQEYGNINPIEPTPGNVNLGTDIRTKDLPQNFYFTLPFNAEVVEITQDDGTRFGDQSGHKGYGNSVLLRLPNGSMIRMAHLSDMENFSVGDIVGAFDYIGTPGQSGNTYGEHLDLEYYTPEGQISDPESFFINSMDYIDTDAIMQSREDKSTLAPEEKQWAEAQQNLLKQGVQMSLDPNSLRPQAPGQAQEQPQQEYRPFQTIREAGQELAQNVGEAVQPMSPQRQALAQVPEQLAQKAGLQAELGLSEGVAGQDPMQARISALSQQPKVPTQERDLFGKFRQLAGNVTERVGDVLGIPEGVASETIAGGATKRTNQALASEIGGEKPEAIPGIRQNIKDIGRDLATRATQAINPIVARAGEGIDALKQKASNLFQKTPLMGLFQGQKQVGNETPGTTLIETAGQRSGTPAPDAFFKYGGADQYAKYLIANADQAKGGALDTSLFTPEFFQDPNRVANVFGETSQGQQATGKYKEYLGSQIKEGFNEPYRTERKQEGDEIVEYQIPIQEYFQNQYYKNLLSETPDTLKSGFSFDQFQLPTVSRSASEFKGEAPTQTGKEPIFKSGVVDLFRKAGSTMGKLAGDVFKTPAQVYQPSQQSQKFAVPEALSRVFATPSATNLSVPTTTRTVVERIQPKAQPTLQDYLRMGKTEAQYFAETGQQSVADKYGGAEKARSAMQINQIAPYTGMSSSQIAQQLIKGAGNNPAISKSIQQQQAQEKTQGGLQLPSGAIFDTQRPEAAQSAQLVQAPAAKKDNWLQQLFKRIF